MKKTYLTKLAKISEAVCSFKEGVDEMREDLEITYENRSDSWQESDAGEEMREDIDNLEILSDAFDEVISALEAW